jgi:hypothetical protein
LYCALETHRLHLIGKMKDTLSISSLVVSTGFKFAADLLYPRGFIEISISNGFNIIFYV